MGGGDALLFLVNVLFDLALGALLLRVLLQVTRADFYNPLSQLVWKVTNPVTQPLRPLIPKLRNVDTASLVVMLIVATIYVALIGSMFGGLSPLAWLWYGLLKCLVLACKLYTLTLFAQAVLSWIGPGGHNPAAGLLDSLNEPLVSPVRKFIPPLGGFDFSPLVVILALQVLVRLIPLPVLFR